MPTVMGVEGNTVAIRGANFNSQGDIASNHAPRRQGTGQSSAGEGKGPGAARNDPSRPDAKSSQFERRREPGLCHTRVCAGRSSARAAIGLNSAAHGGTPTTDPHHDDWEAEEQYAPIVNDCRSDEEIKHAMRDFANSYTGSWSWFLEFGNHCHSFQKSMMSAAELSMYKVIR